MVAYRRERKEEYVRYLLGFDVDLVMIVEMQEGECGGIGLMLTVNHRQNMDQLDKEGI